MEKDNIYTEEQEKELIERINEIKNQTKKENNNNVQINEQPIENNNTAGIENVIVYQDNAKKTMKRQKGIAIALATIVLAGGIIFGVSKNNNNKQPIEPVEMITYIDENGDEKTVEKYIYMTYDTGQFFGEYYYKVTDEDYLNYNGAFFYSEVLGNEQEKQGKDGYDENDPNDKIMLYDPTADSLSSFIFSFENGNIEIIFEEYPEIRKDFEIIDGKLMPKDGIFTYYLKNNIPITVKCTFDPEKNVYAPDKCLNNAVPAVDANEYYKNRGSYNYLM